MAPLSLNKNQDKPLRKSAYSEKMTYIGLAEITASSGPGTVLSPDVDVVGGHTRRRLAVVAGRAPVDEGLEDRGPEHGEACDEEAGVDTFDGGEVDTAATEEGVDDFVEQGDEDDDGDGVQVSVT